VSSTFQAEAAILQGMEHPYIVKLLDVYVSNRAVYLVMELLHGGDLFDRIVDKGKYSEVQGRRIMRRLLSAICYLHEERNIVHRDLKPENILCVNHENDIEVKLTDFGLAKAINGDEDGLKTFCGTPQYFAPEVLRRRHTVAGRGRYGKQADMWSLGVILYVLLSGTPPFDVGQGYDVVVDVKIEFPEEHWAGVSEKARDLVTKMLVTDPRKRVSVLQACKHEWIMTEDGDTHVYPLDDPKVSVSKKRLFPLTAGGNEDTDITTPPVEEEVDVDVDIAFEAGMTDTVAENENKVPLSEQKDTNVGFGIMHGFADADADNDSESPKVAEKEAGPNTHLEPAPIAAVDSTDRPVLLPLSLNEGCAESGQSARSILSEDAEVNSKLCVDDIDEPPKDEDSARKDENSPIENRRVSDEYTKYGQSEHSTLSGDAEVNHQLLEDIDDEPPKDEDSSCEDDHFPVENRRVSDENVAANAVTPSASNKRQTGPSADKYIPGYQNAEGAELSEDEICSQFSNRTESISGFSGSGDEEMVGVAETQAVAIAGAGGNRSSIFGNAAASLNKNRPETRDSDSSACQSKKRRITDAADQSVSKIGPNKTLKTSNSGSARTQGQRRITDAADQSVSKIGPNKTLKTSNSGSARTQEQSDSSPGPALDAQQCTKTAVQGHGGGKQTTLSSWFKKSA
jgi:serine/threonine protein kinase